MSDAEHSSGSVAALLDSAEALIGGHDEPVSAATIERVVHLLRDAERATPGGSPLHRQLDNVKKWVEALGRPDEHHRFGGTARIRDYVAMQFRLARAAAEDYRQAIG